MIVEVIGLPGSGKSTLLHSIVQRRRDPLIVPLEYAAIEYFLEHMDLPIYKRSILRLKAADRMFRMSDRLLNGNAHKIIERDPLRPESLELAIVQALDWANEIGISNFLTLAARFRKLLALYSIRGNVTNSKHLIVDEGFSVQWANLHINAFGDNEFAKRYFSSIPVPDILLWLRIEPNLALGRMQVRDISKDSKRVRFTQEYYTCLDHVYMSGVDLLASRGAMVIEIDAELPVRDVVDSGYRKLVNALS